MSPWLYYVAGLLTLPCLLGVGAGIVLMSVMVKKGKEIRNEEK